MNRTRGANHSSRPGFPRRAPPCSQSSLAADSGSLCASVRVRVQRLPACVFAAARRTDSDQERSSPPASPAAGTQ